LASALRTVQSHTSRVLSGSVDSCLCGSCAFRRKRKGGYNLNLAQQNWILKALRQARRHIDERSCSTEQRERAVGALVKITYILLEA
jgi:hypothetical protein